MPREHRRKALVVGAMLGTMPDLDVFIDYGDVVRNFTYHRGFSHSLFVLPGAALLIWLALKRWWAPVRGAPRQWLLGISLALITHPLLDAHTAYGTQLLWPLAVTPTSWSTLFIIDPLFTLPMLLPLLLVIGRDPSRPWRRWAPRIGLGLATAYAALSLGFQLVANQRFAAAIAAEGIPARRWQSTVSVSRGRSPRRWNPSPI